MAHPRPAGAAGASSPPSRGRYDDAAWLRGRGWALSIATAMVAHSDDAPVLAAVGREALAHVLDG
ncbi:hypothetical protein [Georgenia sp. SUBG003]|uniref:hypothetical protein n=1 Tax=Georgenia sp. SUBG003 TaxID=1497974 RepID=UPI0004D3FC78|nr:hypothetical protein DA06_07995 [Georgenia sp. SUBG003]